MEPVSAVLGFLGSVVGGVTSYLGIDRQAAAIEHQADVERDIQLGGFDAWVQGMFSQERSLLAGYHYQRDSNWIWGDVQRDRIFYNYMAANSLRGSVVAVAGVGLLALATYLALKGD